MVCVYEAQMDTSHPKDAAGTCKSEHDLSACVPLLTQALCYVNAQIPIQARTKSPSGHFAWVSSRQQSIPKHAALPGGKGRYIYKYHELHTNSYATTGLSVDLVLSPGNDIFSIAKFLGFDWSPNASDQMFEAMIA